MEAALLFAVTSGATAVTTKTIQAPAGRVKLLLQNQGAMVNSGRLDTRYRGIIDCVVRIYRTEGLRSFWKGNLINCLGYFPTQALNFALKHQMQALFKPQKGDNSGTLVTKNLLAGGMSGVASLFFVYPFNYCYVRLANDVKSVKDGGRQFSGIIDVYKKTYASDGFVGMYRGITVSCVGIFMYRGLYFGLYDTLRPVLGGGNNPLHMFALGYAVTLTAGVLCYPLDTIKSRMMMTSIEEVKYRGMIDCGRQIIRREGFMSLMRGVSVNIFLGISGALMMVGYDMAKRSFVKSRSDS